MVIEEPSVVAAVSGAAKTICGASLSGSFEAFTSERNIIYAQIQLLDIPDDRADAAVEQIAAHKEEILRIANESCASMHKRGGGALDVTARKIRRTNHRSQGGKNPSGTPNGIVPHNSFWIVVHVHIDVCDAMGANCASSVAEGVAPFLSLLTNARVGFRIVSNLAVERIATSRFRMPASKLAYKGIPGEVVADRLVESYEWACDDPFRAVTHNKGIMNGIDAVAVAAGQDWRAIEAAAHAWAGSIAGVPSADALDASGDPLGRFAPKAYRPLTKYWTEIDEATNQLLFCGEMSMPVCVGTSGGVLKTNPVYHYTLGLMGHPDAKKLSMILVTVGLAQNFAAMRALSTEGIQRGHMSLHARNIAIAAGAPAHAIQECVSYMIECGRITSLAATEYLAAHHLQTQIKQLGLAETPNEEQGRRSRQLSMFYFEEQPTAPAPSAAAAGKDAGARVRSAEERISLNIAFASYSDKPVNIELTASGVSSSNPLVASLFGGKTFEWINAVPGLLDQIKLTSNSTGLRRSNITLAKKLKLISVLLNILARRLLALHPAETTEFLGTIIELAKSPRSSTDGLWVPSSTAAATLDSAADDASQDSHKRLAGVGIFQRDVYNAIDEVHARTNAETLLVGIPLLLAFWQVFHYRVVQWVGDATLALDLLEEQRRIIETLASQTALPASIESAIEAGVAADPAEAHDHMLRLTRLHSQRFQATLILLCDAISLNVPLKTQRQRHAMRSLGQRLEIEQTLGHDLSPTRLVRDLELVRRGGVSITGNLRAGLVNVFLAWLVLRGWSTERILGLAGLHGADHAGDAFLGVRAEMVEFLREMAPATSLAAHAADAAAASESGESGEAIPTLDLERIVRQYRQYYGVAELFSAAAVL
nr:hypothetical protein HK105_006386 [Polyrhizophydium stewartii]